MQVRMHHTESLFAWTYDHYPAKEPLLHAGYSLGGWRHSPFPGPGSGAAGLEKQRAKLQELDDSLIFCRQDQSHMADICMMLRLPRITQIIALTLLSTFLIHIFSLKGFLEA